MRGKVFSAWYGSSCDRITPAYAGKSIDQLKYGSISEDHPRLCGEKNKILDFMPGDPGSPPPMRGKECV